MRSYVETFTAVFESGRSVSPINFQCWAKLNRPGFELTPSAAIRLKTCNLSHTDIKSSDGACSTPKRLVLPAPDPEIPVARLHFVVASPVWHLRDLRLSCPVAEAVCAMTAASAICLSTGLLDVAFADFQLSSRFWFAWVCSCAAVALAAQA